jgi:glycosyltransferase involved in cell wall biosynthesis
VIGHLRDEKDSLRAAYAARLVPENSHLRVTNLGKAHTAEWADAARDEMTRNPRFAWRGEVDGNDVRRQLANSHAMVISSVMEGGANVVSEAIAAGLPVIASRIDGNIGLLGQDYDGYYPAKDTEALAAVLSRAETDPGFLSHLTAQCAARAPLFEPARETAAWKDLLAEIRA